MGNIMTEILNKITEGTACWYPSAGADFDAIKLWQGVMGNELFPNTFIFSDI